MDEILTYQRKHEDDYYFILGCHESSTEEQITAEYKAQVLLCHPDKQQNDATAHEKFARLSQAKDTLLDPEKRKEYDKWRHSGIAIPFETWRSMSHVKTSMHWGYQKEQVAISHPEGKEPTSSHCKHVPSSHASKSQSLIDLEEKLKFTLREPSSKSSTPECKRDIQSNSNPMLEKFRNYQI
ncbi:unnamed protein product [Lymnaea stagnalis]|uniref:J domain-containing protein n=1 Tax=Lymnaea stagnalis TaxID=6523 RepID=A0AAV2IHB9_LYMST